MLVSVEDHAGGGGGGNTLKSVTSSEEIMRVRVPLPFVRLPKYSWCIAQTTAAKTVRTRRFCTIVNMRTGNGSARAILVPVHPHAGRVHSA